MSNISLTDGHIDNAEHCVCCGAVIPEGRQVCIICGLKTNYKQSTDDVVEVVRCKDCKNAYINSFSAQSGIALCKLLTNRANGEQMLMRQDDFCSYGERKDGE